jgi:NTP pyrophosphatase (non-canonical NTP hydrolase)
MSMLTFQALEMLVIRWAKDRQIIGKASAETQALKTVAEMGELCEAVIRGDRAAQAGEVGDVFACLLILCEMLDLDATECLEMAYDKCKSRTGASLPNGTFVKAGPPIGNPLA